jgi:cytochrome c biogenesis protein ResB
MVHVGMAIVFAGALYGRLPGNTFQKVAPLAPGQSFPVEVGDESFEIRLLEAGGEYDAMGRPEKFWAKTELLVDGEVIKSHTIQPNHPLRHRWVNATLNSLLHARPEVQVQRGEHHAHVPLIGSGGHAGGVDMERSSALVGDPPWVVFVSAYRERDESGAYSPAAKVFMDRSGRFSHNWEQVGWVGEEGAVHDGASFRLVGASQGAQLSLDRDVGVPAVWFGFCVLSVGSLLLVTTTRRTCAVLVEERGSASEVTIGFTGYGAARELAAVAGRIEDELGGKRRKSDSGQGED